VRAHADVVVERIELADRSRRRRVYEQLYAALGMLGHVDSIERWVLDPPDGPHRDTGYHLGAVDFDRFAVVRVIGHVTPLTRRES